MRIPEHACATNQPSPHYFSELTFGNTTIIFFISWIGRQMVIKKGIQEWIQRRKSRREGGMYLFISTRRLFVVFSRIEWKKLVHYPRSHNCY